MPHSAPSSASSQPKSRERADSTCQMPFYERRVLRRKATLIAEVCVLLNLGTSPNCMMNLTHESCWTFKLWAMVIKWPLVKQGVIIPKSRHDFYTGKRMWIHPILTLNSCGQPMPDITLYHIYTCLMHTPVSSCTQTNMSLCSPCCGVEWAWPHW